METDPYAHLAPWAKKIVAVISILATVFTVCCFFCWATEREDYRVSRNLNGPHMHDRAYEKALGIREIEYDAVVKRYGEPERVEVLPGNQKYPDYYIACYAGLSCNYVMSELHPVAEPGVLTPVLTQITVMDDRFRFGKSKIGVGSTREAIHKAYEGSKPLNAEDVAYCMHEFPGIEEGYWGDYWCNILFSYDENDCVDAMAYQPSDFW